MKKTKSEILSQVPQEVLKSRFVANNTLEILYKDESKAIRLHNTDILTFKPNGDIILNSGGWMTPTTKARMNQFLNEHNIYISQKNHIWYINGNILYYDNIKFNKDGKLKTKAKKINTSKITKIKTEIKNFVNLIDTLPELPRPSGGDCWSCAFIDTKTKKPLGDITNDTHLKQHIKEKYIFGSLLVNAMREQGYKDEQIAMHYSSNWRDGFKHSLYRYLVKKLVLGGF